MVKVFYFKVNNNENHDYTRFQNKLKEFPNSLMVTENCWMLNSNSSCSDLRDELSKWLHFDDELFVTEITDYSGRNLKCGQQKLNNAMNANSV